MNEVDIAADAQFGTDVDVLTDDVNTYFPILNGLDETVYGYLSFVFGEVGKEVGPNDQKSPLELTSGPFKIIPATSYSPTQFPAQYHRLQQA